MRTVEKMVRMPVCIGQEPLVGNYYTVECKLCGWVGSSEVLTDDCQCTQDEGDRLWLGDTDEIGTDRLLEIVQAMDRRMVSRKRLTNSLSSTPTKPSSTWTRPPSCLRKLSRAAKPTASAPTKGARPAGGSRPCLATSPSSNQIRTRPSRIKCRDRAPMARVSPK